MNWKKLHFYLHTFCRYFLATIILMYAFAKILETQFTSLPSTYDQPIDSLNGFDLTWYYFGYSFWYGIVIAVAQIASSLLLFFRKTTRLGIILFLSFMINILLVDYAYDIHGAKGVATLMTVMALFLLLSEYKSFIKFFFKEPPLYQDSKRPQWINKISKVKWVYIPIAFIGMYFGISTLKAKYMFEDEFYGTWINTDITAKHKYFNFEDANTFKINGIHNIDPVAMGKYSFTNDSITLETYTEDYRDFITENTTDELSNSYTVKLVTLLKAKYHLNEDELIIQNDTSKIVLKRIR